MAMTDTAVDPVTVPPPSEQPANAGVRLKRWQSFGIAVGSLVVIYGLGICVMLAGGVVIHTLKPTRHIDIVAAFHNAWVVGILLGIAVLWLLPPHPWAKRVVAPRPPE